MSTHLNALGQPIGPPLPDWQAPPRPTATVLDGVFTRLERLDPDRHGRALHEANALDTSGANWTYLPIGPFATFEAYDAWLRTMAPGADPYFFAIIDRATSLPVGVASYLRIDPAAGSIEVGHINFSPLAQRTSVASETMFLMMRHAFALGYRRYEWKCDALNAPSRVAAERLGFTYEGPVPPGHHLQGTQSRHRLVFDSRSRVPGARARLPRMAGARQPRRQRPAGAAPLRAHRRRTAELSTRIGPHRPCVCHEVSR